jgi:hypothetical protein
MSVAVLHDKDRHYFDNEWPQLLDGPLTVLEVWKHRTAGLRFQAMLVPAVYGRTGTTLTRSGRSCWRGL